MIVEKQTNRSDQTDTNKQTHKHTNTHTHTHTLIHTHTHTHMLVSILFLKFMKYFGRKLIFHGKTWKRIFSKICMLDDSMARPLYLVQVNSSVW